VSESSADQDLGSGGILLLPDVTDSGGVVRHLAVGAGKDGNLYVVSRDSLGKFSSSGNNIWQQLPGVLSGGIFSTPAYFNGAVYYGPVGAALMAFTVKNAQLSSAASATTGNIFGYPGTSPAVSANGSSDGIIWAHENSDPAVLHAYDAGNLGHELYNSSQAAGGRDRFGAGNKFITPMIADGKVFVGTQGGVAVFGLLN
jgi:outer membrane protein assembly factor BamB